MKKKTWLFFCGLNLLGCVFASYGTVYSESAFVRWSWLAGFILLLPGDIVAMTVTQVFWKWTIHIKEGYMFIPLTIASNAVLWATWAAAWRRFRPKPSNRDAS
jgi:hypothetical protein